MPRIIKDFSEDFIGIVYGYDANTREIEVFIPKLMPAVPEGREDIKTKTNLATVAADYNVKYNSQITLTSTITAKAADVSSEMPKIGSRVYIEFFEDNPMYPLWSPWNYNGDYEIIDEEKYPEYFQFRIGDKETPLNKNDSIEIQLPNGYEVVRLMDNADEKHKVFKINNENTVDGRIEKIENIIGNTEFTMQYEDKFGNLQYETIESSGLYKLIQTLQREIKNLSNELEIHKNDVKFIGTRNEYMAANSAGLIKEGTIVYITDDDIDGDIDFDEYYPGNDNNNNGSNDEEIGGSDIVTGKTSVLGRAIIGQMILGSGGN